MRYRRAHIPGACYFFTVNVLDRNSTLLTDHIDVLKGSIRHVKQRHPFRIDAMVVLPEHLHAMWTLPDGDADFSNRWRLIKSAFSRALPKDEHSVASRQSKGERGIWQRRFWEHVIRDEDDFANHVDYIHFNPVKHGHVNRPVDWPYSSIHKFIREGVVSHDWGCADNFDDMRFGERE